MPSSNPDRRTLHVVSHTHWDREWYLNFQQFRYRLVRLIDRLMDLLDADPGYKVFHLDAQTIVLEDYLAVKPGNRDRLERFIRQGRILIGPWYQLDDNYLVSGESTIRSLLIGHRVAQSFGDVMKIGYLPDQFGNISQLPQIFKGFGIPYALVGRGRDMKPGEKMEFVWESPDGSRALTTFVAFWYNNFERIPDTLDAAVARVNELENDLMAPVSASNHLLFMNGVDHFEAQENLAPMIRAVNESRSEGGVLKHSTLAEYFKGIEGDTSDLEVVSGELRSGHTLGGLAGTLSSRVYLKQANAKCQTLLERYAEPLCSIANRLGDPYPAEYLTWAWKRLMENHPHDSICGCSQDQVHREMVFRFEEVEQVARELINQAFTVAASQLPAPAPVEAPGRQTTFAIFNPLSFARTEVVEVTLDFPLGAPGRGAGALNDGTDVEHIAVYDDQGKPVTFHVRRSEIAQTRVISPTVLPMAQIHRRFVVQIRAVDVPALGFRNFRAIAWAGNAGIGQAGSTMSVGGKATGPSLIKRSREMENEHVEVRVFEDGRFTAFERKTFSMNYCDMNLFEDGGDVGDEYVYRAPRRDAIAYAINSPGQMELIEDTPLAAAWRIRTKLEVPVSATLDREARTEERVDLPIETVVRLTVGSPYVEVTTTVANSVRDHRLRALFESSYPVFTTTAQEPFDVVERPPVPPEQRTAVASQHPFEQWVDTTPAGSSEDVGGFTVIAEGLYEHELLIAEKDSGAPSDDDDDDRLAVTAVTLLRCVDRITMHERDCLGHDRCPDAQCEGTHTFRYAVLPHAGTWETAKVWRAAHAFHAPMTALQTPEAERQNTDHNAKALTGEPATRPAYLVMEPDSLVLSAYKRCEERDTQIVRFWNIGTSPVEGRIGVPGARSVWLTNLNEERSSALTLDGDGVTMMSVKPKEIVTVEFEV